MRLFSLLIEIGPIFNFESLFPCPPTSWLEILKCIFCVQNYQERSFCVSNTHVYLWRIHFDIWQNLYNYVKFKNKIKLKK